MVDRHGQVIEVAGELARLKFDSTPGCTGCAGGQGCGIGPIVALFRQTGPTEIVIDTSHRIVRPGDQVRVRMQGSRLAGAAALAYLLPLAAMVSGALIGDSFAGDGRDLPGIAGAATGLFISWVFLTRFGRRRLRSLLRLV